MTRPLRSLLIGDCDHYLSPYIFGVAQACGRLGIWHTQVNIRAPAHVIADRVRAIRPDLLWTHMLLWAPEGSPPRADLLAICAEARRAGALVLLHDGDVKAPTRFPFDISAAVDLALCNHRYDRSAWHVRAIRWPYAAFPQDEIASPVEDLRCDVAFTGRVSREPMYVARAQLLDAIARADALHVRIFDGTPETGGNTLLRTPEIATSAMCVLGAGRPEAPGWTDVRVFQYPGAGAILLHDQAEEWLTPNTHFVPYRSGDAQDAIEAARFVAKMPESERHRLRQRAFKFVQAKHSYVARVREVLGIREGRA